MDILWIIIAYILGSIPFGLIIAKLVCNIDPRQAGSGNIGSTNISRLCGKKWGMLTLFCDVLKGALAVIFALHVSDNSTLHSLCALAAIIGHTNSCFLKFKGGKGVATSIGVLIPLILLPLLASCLLCVIVIWRSGYVSPGSLTLAASLPIFTLLYGRMDTLPLTLIIMIIICLSHKDNIKRLIRGEEKGWIKNK